MQRTWSFLKPSFSFRLQVSIVNKVILSDLSFGFVETSLNIVIIFLILIKQNVLNSQDKEAPILICPTNRTFETNSGQPTAAAEWNGLIAADNSGKNLTTICSADSGSQFEIGQTEIVCEVWDLDRNHATCIFTVDVIGKKNQGYITISCYKLKVVM